MSVTYLKHNRISLALHTLRLDGVGHPLLILHGLGAQSPPTLPEYATEWPGQVYALDFTGHGLSTIPRGGGYTAEILMADADAALAHIGPSTIVGHGLGGYVALLLAGARPGEVLGTVLTDGPGMAGGSAEPTSLHVVTGIGRDSAPDPYALVELSRDLRPADYAPEFTHLAASGSLLDEPITIVARFRPAWLEAVAAQPGSAEAASVAEALSRYRTFETD